RRIVDLELGSIARATLTGKDVPGRLQVAGRIADVQATEVDDRRQAAVDDEQVARQEVAVHPDLAAVPLPRRERLLPRPERGGVVAAAAELRDRTADRTVQLREWRAPSAAG